MQRLDASFENKIKSTSIKKINGEYVDFSCIPYNTIKQQRQHGNVCFMRLCVQIKASVLLMLGDRDRRVSPHQGLELYRALKSRALPVRLSMSFTTALCSLSVSGLIIVIETDVQLGSIFSSRLLWFPEDGHSLSRVDTQADCFLNTVLWLQEHLWKTPLQILLLQNTPTLLFVKIN